MIGLLAWRVAASSEPFHNSSSWASSRGNTWLVVCPMLSRIFHLLFEDALLSYWLHLLCESSGGASSERFPIHFSGESFWSCHRSSAMFRMYHRSMVFLQAVVLLVRCSWFFLGSLFKIIDLVDYTLYTRNWMITTKIHFSIQNSKKNITLVENSLHLFGNSRFSVRNRTKFI